MMEVVLAKYQDSELHSSSIVIRPMTVASSANLMMGLELWVATQLCVNREYRKGVNTHL